MSSAPFSLKRVCQSAGWIALAAAGPVLAAPPSSVGAPEVTAAMRHDTSPRLAEMPSAERTQTAFTRRTGPLAVQTGPSVPDGALQTTIQSQIATMNGLNFPGVGNGDYGFKPNAAPPDTNGAVGATQYVQWVNESFAVFNKSTGTIVAGFPKAGNTLWAGFGGGCETNNDGDPIVQYDKAANRWILTQFSVSTLPYTQCVAVSTTSDATGTYYRYAFTYGSTQFNDYPKLSVWPDAYYITFNIFNNAQTFAGAKACAYDRAKMLTGAAATQVCFQLSTAYGGLLPADLDGSTAPPAGAPNYLFNLGSNSVNQWKFHVDFTTPTNSTLTGPFNIPVAAFTAACGGGACIPQPGTSNKLDSLADRPMYRLAYRNLNGTESILMNHSVKVSGTKRAEVDGVRWYEFRDPGAAGGASVFQQGTYSPTADSRWMGSIAMDKVGNIAMGYSVSSSSVYPSIRYTGRLPTDPAGTMQTESGIVSGGGSQTGTLHRWGDYSAMTVDPVDDCTFWYTTEYMKTTGTFNWNTQIASFKFPGCQ